MFLLIGALDSSATWGLDSSSYEYHGWHIDFSRAREIQSPELTVSAINRQLDIVESAKLSPDILAFMKSVPIWTDPSRRWGGAGHYSRDSGVDLHVRELDAEKPIVLHELLHAYHDQRLGLDNPDIESFYQSARASGVWTSEDYFLRDNREFFAVTASIYLTGDIDRPPFSRAKIHQALPDYYHWLATQFDAGRERSW